MLDKYIEEIKVIIKKYSYSYFTIDYKSMLNEIINLIDTQKIDEKYFDKILFILVDFTYKINRKDINKYIKILKKYKIYKYQLNKRKRLFMKLFFKQYVIMHMIKNKRYIFFRKKMLPSMSNKMKKRIKIFLDKKDCNVFQRLKTLLPNKLYVDYLELVITTKCTLKCKNCANLMHLYEKPYNVDKDIIVNTLKKLNSCVDEVYLFRILGGEPFCNPELKYYLNELPVNKFKKIVIVTNGTLVPKDMELIKLIKQKNITIEISNYGKYSKKKEELINLLEKENINFNLVDSSRVWYDYGILENKNRKEEEVKQQFLDCNTHCKSILNGGIYYCPRHSHGIDLGIIKRNNDEFVDLINNNDKLNKKQLKKLMLRKKYVEACKYCDYATSDCKVVPAAQQCSKK